MSNRPRSALWSDDTDISIVIQPVDERTDPSIDSDHVCPTCKLSPREHPIHCVSATSNSLIPGRLDVPNLRLETSNTWPTLEPPGRALRFDTKGKPQVRFRQNAFSPLSPSLSPSATKHKGIGWGRQTQATIETTGPQPNPDTCPVTPGTAEKQGEEIPDRGASNFAQRIEQKLWDYSNSRNVAKRWLLEILSWTLSALCMGGIIGVLAFYQNKRIPDWVLGITLNAYISILSKFATAALLLPVSEALGQLKWHWFHGNKPRKIWDFEIFDNASRGPWGSLHLLVRTRGRSLAALGAIITIFALCLDQTFQQVVEYPEKWRVQEATGSLARAISYTVSQTGIEYIEGTENTESDQNIRHTAYSYFFQNGTEPMQFNKGIRAEVPLSCPTNNCTWPEYETLGLCSDCTDVSDRLEFKCLHNKPLDWVQTPDRGDDGQLFYSNGSSCGWWLMADDPLLMTGYNIDPDTLHTGEILIERAQALYNVHSRQPLLGYQPRLNNTRNPLLQVVIASGETSSHVKSNATPIANECAISWCVKKMSSSYSEGGYTEAVLETYINDTLGPSPWYTEYLYNEDPLLEGWYYEYKEPAIIKSPSGQIFSVDSETFINVALIFDDIFPSQYTLFNSTDDKDARLRYKQYKTLVAVIRSMKYNAYLYPNITEHLALWADAMTNTIRSSTANTTEHMIGPAFSKETFVEVRWGWLSLPLALLTITFFFLAATIIRSSAETENAGAMKSSALATILNGLPDHMRKKMAGRSDGRPRDIKVKWRPSEGWRFSGNSTLSLLKRGSVSTTNSSVISSTPSSPTSQNPSNPTLASSSDSLAPPKPPQSTPPPGWI